MTWIIIITFYSGVGAAFKGHDVVLETSATTRRECIHIIRQIKKTDGVSLRCIAKESIG